MKTFLSALLLTIAVGAFAQSKDEQDILKLSKTVFDLEVANKIDSLADIFDQKFMVVASTGDIQTKEQYIARLKSGSFKHNSITVEQSIATVQNNTAAVVGKGKFNVTVVGKEASLHLSYIEVFTRNNKGWKLLAMHVAALSN